MFLSISASLTISKNLNVSELGGDANINCQTKYIKYDKWSRVSDD